jgi:4-aminobutyrate aminotransferase-like enzyme
MQQFVDFRNSRGDYFADIDGNTILDLNASAGGFALGYNNEDLVN